MRAEQVLAALEHDLIRDEFRPSGLFIPEVEAPGASRRADLIWMTARTATITGYEIKVSRSDLLAELRDPTKCEPWLKFCDFFWLAISDESLLDGLLDKVPDDWGICTPPTNARRRKMEVIRPAPKLAPADKAPVLGKLISHQAYRNMALQRKVREAEAKAERERNTRQSREQNQIDSMRRRANPYEELFRAVGNEFNDLKQAQGSWSRLEHVPASTIAQAIIHAENMEQLAKNASHVAQTRLNDMERVTTELKNSWQWKGLQDALTKMTEVDLENH